MSFKAKIAAGAATLALAGGGLGMVGTLNVQPLSSYSDGTVYDNQLWRNTAGL